MVETSGSDHQEYGVREFGDAAQQIALEQFGKSKAEIRLAMDLSRRFPADSRLPQLTYSHYAAASKLKDDDKAIGVLHEAATKRMSVTKLKKAVNAIRESEGGDVFEQMAQVSDQELIDDWTGKIVHLLNRCPTGVDGRRDVMEMLDAAGYGIIDL